MTPEPSRPVRTVPTADRPDTAVPTRRGRLLAGAASLALALVVALLVGVPQADADGLPPRTTHTIVPTAGVSDDGWATGPVEVHLDVTDAGGDDILRTEYRIDGGDWQVLGGSTEVIFDGTQESLDRWRMAGPGRFVLLPDGTLTTTGGLGMLWYPVREYGDMVLEMEWRDAKPPGPFGASNAGVFIRFPDVDEAVSRAPEDRHDCQGGASNTQPAWVAIHCGHEVQIYDGAGGDPQKTGSIYNFASLGLEQARPVPQGEWTDYAIRVEGGGDYEVTVTRDGTEINRWANTPGQVAPREGDPATDLRQFASGYVGIQNHGSADYIQFRNIRVTDLSDPAPILIEGDGVHVVEYRSTDVAGNVEQVRRALVRIDTAAPVAQAVADGATVTLTADDTREGSGVAAIQHRVDGGDWVTHDPTEVLFDGTQASLDRWTMSGPGAFVLTEDGAMRTEGGLGLLWWPEEAFGDVALRMQWRDARPDGARSNGGVFIRFPDPEAAVDYPFSSSHPCQLGLGLFLAEWVAINCGHEIQVNDGQVDPQRTGSVYNFAPLDAETSRPTPAGEWNDYEVRTVGAGDYDVTVTRNGEVINRWANTPGQRPARAFDPPTDLRQFAEGHIGLQNHGSADTIEYRAVSIVRLDPVTTTVEVPADAAVLEFRAVDLAGNAGPAQRVELG